MDWQRSPFATQSEQEIDIPQTRALLISQHDHLEIPYDASMIPQEIPGAHAQEQQPPNDPTDSHLIEEMIDAFSHYDHTGTAFGKFGGDLSERRTYTAPDPQPGNMNWSNDQPGDEITYEGKGKGKEKEGEEAP